MSPGKRGRLIGCNPVCWLGSVRAWRLDASAPLGAAPLLDAPSAHGGLAVRCLLLPWDTGRSEPPHEAPGAASGASAADAGACLFWSGGNDRAAILHDPRAPPPASPGPGGVLGGGVGGVLGGRSSFGAVVLSDHGGPVLSLAGGPRLGPAQGLLTGSADHTVRLPAPLSLPSLQPLRPPLGVLPVVYPPLL